MNELHSQLEGILRQTSAWNKLRVEITALEENFSRQQFFYLFAICPRWLKSDANSVNISAMLDSAMFDPFGVMTHWRATQVARLYLLIKLYDYSNAVEYHHVIDELFKTADVNEQILLVQSLQFIPQAELFVERAREAARSNIESVFSAVAHNTPYAKTYFNNDGWDQLILKAAFLAVPIWNIVGLKERNNFRLVTMLKDYVLERQAASRSVPWDLFCCPGWLAQGEEDLQFIAGQFQRGTLKIQQAICLALQENAHEPTVYLAQQLKTQLLNPLDSWQAIAELED